MASHHAAAMIGAGDESDPTTALSKQNSEYLRWTRNRLDRARKIDKNQWWQNLNRACGHSIRFCFDNALYRAWMHVRDVRIFADVHVKHGAYADRSMAEPMRNVEFFDAHVKISTGQMTGDANCP